MKLLIAYDGSDCATAALDDLRHAGLPAEGEATVMAVADLIPGLVEPDAGLSQPGQPEPHAAIDPMIVRARAHAARAMADARGLARRGAERFATSFPHWRVRHEAVGDSPYWAFVRRAHELGADLIVVGSHGRSAVGRALLGSVSQAVLHHATCSVRVGRRPPAVVEYAADGGRPVRLLLGVDGSVGSAAAVTAVAGRRWPPGTEVRVVTVPDYRDLIPVIAGAAMVPGPLLAMAVGAPDERAGADRMLRAVSAELAGAGLRVSTVVRDAGDPKHALVREAEEWGADCVFVGAQGLSRLERFLIGSVSAAVAARARCSVEVVRA